MPDLTLPANVRAARTLAYDNAGYGNDSTKAAAFAEGVRQLMVLLPQLTSRESETVRMDLAALAGLLPRAEAIAGRGNRNESLRYFDTGCRCR